VEDLELYARLRAGNRLHGGRCGALRVGNRRIRIDGLDGGLIALLAERWGRFFECRAPADPWCVLELLPAEPAGWLAAAPGETYRLEAINDAAHRVVVSYSFAICESVSPGRWRAAVHLEGAELPGRVFDNLLRWLTARLTLELGGLALHAGGVLRGDRAYLFAGASGSGKSTAIALSAPATSLGDDMAVVLPGREHWLVPALPFDNAERIDHDPPRGLFPVAGIWRLLQADEHRAERPEPALAVASLLGCAAFPWSMPDERERLLQQATRIAHSGLYAHLRFRPDPGFWGCLPAAAD